MTKICLKITEKVNKKVKIGLLFTKLKTSINLWIKPIAKKYVKFFVLRLAGFLMIPLTTLYDEYIDRWIYRCLWLSYTKTWFQHHMRNWAVIQSHGWFIAKIMSPMCFYSLLLVTQKSSKYCENIVKKRSETPEQ